MTMPKNDPQRAQGSVSGTQPTPRAVTVETTLEAITGLSEAYIERAYWSATLKAEALAHRAKVRALLEALVEAVQQQLVEVANHDYRELQAVAARNIALERAENVSLRAALAAAQEWGVRYAADTTSVPTPPEWEPEEKKEVDHA